MKTERRHQLHHNALADWLEEAFKKIKPYQNAILGATLLVVVCVLAVAVWRSHNEAYAGDAWGAMKWPFPPSNQEELDRIAKEYPASTAALWAQVLAADNYLANGSNELFESKAAADDNLKRAVERYRYALGLAESPLLRERAMFGLARALEAQAGADKDVTKDKLNEAIQLYEQLSKSSQSMFKTAAERRLHDLQKKDAQWFYEQFAAFDPKPAKATPSSGSPDAFSPLPENPPTEGELNHSSLIEKGIKDAAAKQAPQPKSATDKGAADKKADKQETKSEATTKAVPAKSEPAKPDSAKPEPPKKDK